MALPVTITGIDTAAYIVGPYQSSGGNYYFFGVDSGTSTTLQCFKATDPASSFSSIATITGVTNNGGFIAGFQPGDVIHLVSESGGVSVTYTYRTFNMATDAFVLSETIQSGLNTADSGGTTQSAASIVVRSDGSVVVLYNGARVASMGTSYSRIVYARRASGGGWTTNVAVDAGGAIDCVSPEVVLGASDRSHFLWETVSTSATNQRVLNSANTLQTATSISNTAPEQAVSYVSGGTTKIVFSTVLGTTQAFGSYFDSSDSPSLSGATLDAFSTTPVKMFNDGTDVWALFRLTTDSDLYVRKSTDNGATWGSAISAFVGTVAAAAGNLSVDGNIYTRGSSVVIPYIVNDNGTLKYNEYVVRTISTFSWYPMDEIGLANDRLTRPAYEMVGY